MNSGRLLKQANQLKRKGSLDEAIACYRKAIEVNPQLSWAYFYLGEALASQGKADATVEAYHLNFAKLIYQTSQRYQMKIV